MTSVKVKLTKSQIKYIMKMLEIEDPAKAADKFASILTSEKVSPEHMAEYLIEIMKRDKNV